MNKRTVNTPKANSADVGEERHLLDLGLDDREPALPELEADQKPRKGTLAPRAAG
jgi:hypothetical protein